MHTFINNVYIYAVLLPLTRVVRSFFRYRLSLFLIKVVETLLNLNIHNLLRSTRISTTFLAAHLSRFFVLKHSSFLMFTYLLAKLFPGEVIPHKGYSSVSFWYFTKEYLTDLKNYRIM